MREMSAHDALKAGETILAHIIAIVAGIVMMAAGIGMGVTMFLLPIGIPLGLLGAAIFWWGLMGYRETRRPEN